MNYEISKMVEDFERGKMTRRELVGHLTAVMAAMAVVPTVGTAQTEATSTFQATSVDHVALSVTDVARSRRFYERHLGLEVTRDNGAESCFLSCGKDFLALFRAQDPGLHHYAFSIDDFSADSVVERLEAAGLTPKRRGNRVYFDDPDGIEVQVSQGG